MIYSNIVIYEPQAGYPERQRHKLLERKCSCLLEQGEKEKALTVIDETIAALAKSDLKGNKLKSKQDRLNRMRKAPIAAAAASKSKDERVKECPRLATPHSRFPSLSDALEVRYEVGRGRYVAAGRAVKCGELIAVERPYAWMLDRGETKALCWHCMRAMAAPVPCPRCSGVMFCSKKCEYFFLDRQRKRKNITYLH